jgi:hypothetical protein
VDTLELSDDELLARTEALAFQERVSNADLIEHLAEIDRRDLSIHRDYGSLYEYCVNRLKMSDGAAYRRIRAVRTYRAFPPVTAMLRDGRLTVESLVMLHPFRQEKDISSLVMKAAGLRSRQLEEMLAGRGAPGPSRDVVRFVAPQTAETIADSSALPLLTESIAPEKNGDSCGSEPPPEKISSCTTSSIRPSVRIAFTADAEFFRILSQARALLHHKYPDGRLEGVLKDALTALLAKKDRGFGWRSGNARGREPARRG